MNEEYFKLTDKYFKKGLTCSDTKSHDIQEDKDVIKPDVKQLEISDKYYKKSYAYRHVIGHVRKQNR